MIDKTKPVKLVGEFIRKRRESLRMSQRALGLLFSPAVTTQFISNVERGVTPLPPTHIPVLAKVLLVSENELMALLEREYALKLTGRLGKTEDPSLTLAGNTPATPSLVVDTQDYAFFRSLYDAFRLADQQSKQAFYTICESILKVKRED